MSNQTILVVDDEQDLLDLIEYNLKKEGFKVLQAENGYDGIQLAKSEIPDLVIFDIMMPKMEGLEVCEFIGDISHELKTPTFAIQGFVETLLNGALEDEEVNRVFLNKVMKNVNRLTFLTKDLMEISKLETGELKSNIQYLFLRTVIVDVVESLQYKGQKENVEILINHIDNDLQIRADRNQIKQVLVNLIENGIKYNKPGGHVRIGVKPFPKNRNRVLLFVEDTGIGIEQPDLVRVTERFFRVDKSRSREKGGTGLGLSIVKHIIEAHGEELFIDSSVNKGTTFSFTLSKVNHASV